jgi:hypothetical protein
MGGLVGKCPLGVGKGEDLERSWGGGGMYGRGRGVGKICVGSGWLSGK